MSPTYDFVECWPPIIPPSPHFPCGSLFPIIPSDPPPPQKGQGQLGANEWAFNTRQLNCFLSPPRNAGASWPNCPNIWLGFNLCENCLHPMTYIHFPSNYIQQKRNNLCSQTLSISVPPGIFSDQLLILLATPPDRTLLTFYSKLLFAHLSFFLKILF